MIKSLPTLVFLLAFIAVLKFSADSISLHCLHTGGWGVSLPSTALVPHWGDVSPGMYQTPTESLVDFPKMKDSSSNKYP